MAEVVDSTGFSINTTPSTSSSYRYGVKITTKLACTLLRVNLLNGCTATNVYLYDSSHNLLDTQSVTDSGGTNPYAVFDYALSNGTSYHILGGSTTTWDYPMDWDQSYPVNRTNVNFPSGTRLGNSVWTDMTTEGHVVKSVTTEEIEAPLDNAIFMGSSF